MVFVHKPEEHLATRLNWDYVEPRHPGHEAMQRLHDLVQEHYDVTGLAKARAVLDNWAEESKNFWQIVSKSEINREMSASTVLTNGSR